MDHLPLLPIKEEHYRTLEIIEKLGDAKAALARLQGRCSVIPDKGLLINTISLREAKISSYLDGISISDDELYKAFSDKGFEVNVTAQEILRYRKALWSGHEYLSTKKKFDRAYFIKAYQEIRQKKEDIRPDFSSTISNLYGKEPTATKTIYTPYQGQKLIHEQLENLASFLNEKQEFNIDPLLKVTIAHYQFAAIHPFKDGNGRAVRILSINCLSHNKVIDVPILLMSKYLLDHKNDYYGTLQGVLQSENWKDWFLFMLTAVETSANITLQKVDKIMNAKGTMLDSVRNDKRKFRKPEQLIEALFTYPMTTVKHLVESGVYAENTARHYLNKLTEMGIVEKKEMEGHHYYLNLELHSILTAE